MFIGILRTIGTVAGLALGGAYMGKFNPSGREIKIFIHRKAGMLNFIF